MIYPWYYPHRYMVGIRECLEALDMAIPGVASDHTLLYGIEAKFYSARPQLNSNLKTCIEGLWASGDGAGVTRGLIQASVSGVTLQPGIFYQKANRSNGPQPFALGSGHECFLHVLIIFNICHTILILP